MAPGVDETLTRGGEHGDGRNQGNVDRGAVAERRPARGGGFVAAAAPAAQSTPAAQSAAAANQCQADEEDGNGQNGAGDQDNVQDENGSNDAAEGDANANGAEDEAAANENGENGTENEAAAAKPGELSEGQDLLPKATISIGQAIKAAQGKASGQLGPVELGEQGGTLVFSVTVGDQEVAVDAADGTVLGVAPAEGHGGDCEDGTDPQAGTPAAG